MARLSRRFHLSCDYHWPGPRSLATTCGVSVDVLSCRYLDVSVPCVRHLTLCIQVKLPDFDTWKSKQFRTTSNPTKRSFARSTGRRTLWCAPAQGQVAKGNRYGP